MALQRYSGRAGCTKTEVSDKCRPNRSGATLRRSMTKSRPENLSTKFSRGPESNGLQILGDPDRVLDGPDLQVIDSLKEISENERDPDGFPSSSGAQNP